ncbi:hypothetical protein E3N88_36401 [Mikania micrantha]|uniref:Serine-threonine/tyrosine-protein kinase catalytic domain-containing protein n=1 Tax=Mikania micrantha TaxID=192012 RepID=A0A5N6M455_9ASTR|nr:hypothetical protein E3N88_36401 [Mikania micrantha]
MAENTTDKAKQTAQDAWNSAKEAVRKGKGKCATKIERKRRDLDGKYEFEDVEDDDSGIIDGCGGGLKGGSDNDVGGRRGGINKGCSTDYCIGGVGGGRIKTRETGLELGKVAQDCIGYSQGTCTSAHGRCNSVTCKTDGYKAPDLQKMKTCGSRADVYAFGIFLLEILLGTKPGKNGQRAKYVDLPSIVKPAVSNEITMEVFDVELLKEGDKRSNGRRCGASIEACNGVLCTDCIS